LHNRTTYISYEKRKKNRQNGRTGVEEFKDYVICDFMAKFLNGMSITM